MSLKPLKKSDLNKAWMKPRRDKARKLQPEYHLIVTEGTDTEPAYFGAIQSIINRRYQGRIQLDVLRKGDNTLNLLSEARKHAEASAPMATNMFGSYKWLQKAETTSCSHISATCLRDI